MVLLLCRQMCLDPIEMQPRAHSPEPGCSEMAAIFYILGAGKRAREDTGDIGCVWWGVQGISVRLNAEDSWN